MRRKGGSVSSKKKKKSEGTSLHPSISQGEPLRRSSQQPKTLPEVLERASSFASPSGEIVYLSPGGIEVHQSYGKLWEGALRVASGLKRLGLKPGDKIILQLEDNQQFLLALWGALLSGAIIAPLAAPPPTEKQIALKKS